MSDNQDHPLQEQLKQSHEKALQLLKDTPGDLNQEKALKIHAKAVDFFQNGTDKTAGAPLKPSDERGYIEAVLNSDQKAQWLNYTLSDRPAI